MHGAQEPQVTRLFLRREDAEWNIVEGEVAVCIDMQEGSHVTGEFSLCLSNHL
jgi:hypothetical protein